MPELPEVETIKNELLGKLVGRRFVEVSVGYFRAVQQPSGEELPWRLRGLTIEGLERRGKYLIFNLSSGEALIFHLGMSGALLLKSSSSPPDRYTRIAFQLDSGWQLLFSDARKFGKVWLIADKDSVIGKLGPEPLNSSCTPEIMARCLAKRSAPVKALLLEQDFIAGVGNIYANEALFRAGLHPLREGKSLSSPEIRRLHGAIKSVLQQAIGNRGTTFSRYQDPSGKPGGHQNLLQVFRKASEPCSVCGTPIERLSVRNRGTYFCPRCQS